MSGVRRWLPTWWDWAVAVTVATGVVASAALALSTPKPTGLVIACGMVSAVALLGRTRAPVATLLIVSICGAIPTVVAATYPDFYASFVPQLVAIYSIACIGSTRQTALVPVLGIATLVTFRGRVPSFMTVSQFVFIVAGLSLAFGAGHTMRLLRTRADVEAARADLMVREHDLQAREAVATERERIARELHDVVAHDVAVMVVHAGAAERVLANQPDRVAESLTQIQVSGRKAIDELHLLLGMLRDADTELVSRTGLDKLPELVDELARAGLRVSLQVSGEVQDVGDAIDQSAYRVVQEALTNVLKHAPGSCTRIDVDYGTTSLRIAVIDDGDGETAPPDLPTSGHGIAGMRERVRVFGGTLTTGARQPRGWAVTAELPISAASQ